MSSNVLKPYERIIINQRNKIRTLTNELIKMCQKYITSPYRIPNLLKQISQTEQFDKFTQVLGARFVNEVNTWNRVAFANYLETGYAKNAFFIYKGLSADNELKSFLAKQAEEKAKLFKSIPVELANTIVPKIEKLTVQGATPKTVAYELAKDIPSLLEYQVKTIARTETSKTSVAITGFKSKKNNIPCYQWKASGGRQGDGRTRSSHCKMSDVIIFWEDPPAPEDLFPIIGKNGQRYKNTLGHYHAGCCPNCRCLASPVIFIDDLKFPVRVYTQGMIKTMTKKDFLALYNVKVGELKAENAQKKQLNRKVEIKNSEVAKEQIKEREADNFEAEIDRIGLKIKAIQSEVKTELEKESLNINFLKSKQTEFKGLFNELENIERKMKQLQDSIIKDDQLVKDKGNKQGFNKIQHYKKEIEASSNVIKKVIEIQERKLAKSIDEISEKGRNDFDIEFNKDKNDKRGFYYHVNKHISEFRDFFKADETKYKKELEYLDKLEKSKVDKDDNYRFHLTEEEYAILGKVYDEEAQKLVKQAVDEKNVFGFKTTFTGHIVRYDKKRNWFVKGDFRTGRLMSFFTTDYSYFMMEQEDKNYD